MTMAIINLMGIVKDLLDIIMSVLTIMLCKAFDTRIFTKIAKFVRKYNIIVKFVVIVSAINVTTMAMIEVVHYIVNDIPWYLVF